MRFSKTLIAVVSAITLNACGGGGGSTPTPTPTPTPSPTPSPTPQTERKELSGTWFHYYEETQCMETYIFGTDGSFEILSNEEHITGVYEFQEEVNAGERHSLVMNISDQTFGLDCENASERVFGLSLKTFADFQTDVAFNLHASANDPEVLITLQKDNPISISALPNSVDWGQTLTFKVDRQFGSNQSFVLDYGPTGMVIDEQGVVTWTPTQVQLGQPVEVNFSISSPGALQPIEESIRMNTPEGLLPLTRTWTEVPSVNNNILIANFDNQTGNEILLGTSVSTISLMEEKDGEYVQKWTYPFALGDMGEILYVDAFDLEANGISEIFVATEKHVYVIESLDEPARKLFEVDGYIKGLAVNDVDEDGHPEIVTLIDKNSIHNATPTKLSLWSMKNNEESFVIDLGANARSVLIGNTDADPALELVTSSGHVYDGVTGENEWFYPDTFTDHFVLGDINADGTKEIITFGDLIRVLNQATRSVSAEFEPQNIDYCSTTAANIDSDPEEEIIFANCQWGDIYAYDLSSSPVTIKWQTDMIDHGAASIVVGDSDNDSQPELLWATGITSTGEDHLIVADLGDSPQVAWKNEDPAQLHGFAAAGWGHIAPGKDRAVFVASRSDSGYAGQRIVQMSITGELEVSDEVSGNWEGGRHGRMTDYNLDGYADILLSSAQNYSGFFVVKEVDTNTTLWGGTPGQYSDNYSVVDHADVNDDGHQDALVVNSETLQIIDLQNQRIIENKNFADDSNNGHIYDLAVWKEEDSLRLVVATYSGLHLFDMGRDGLTELASNSDHGQCRRIGILQLNNEIMCLAVSTFGHNSYKRFDSNLSLLSNTSPEGYKVTDFIPIPNSNNILAGISEGSLSFHEPSYLAEIDPSKGKIVWQSAELHGAFPHRGMVFIPDTVFGRTSVMFASGVSMYLTR